MEDDLPVSSTIDQKPQGSRVSVIMGLFGLYSKAAIQNIQYKYLVI
jgi:hypothetical protein